MYELFSSLTHKRHPSTLSSFPTFFELCDLATHKKVAAAVDKHHILVDLSPPLASYAAWSALLSFTGEKTMIAGIKSNHNNQGCFGRFPSPSYNLFISVSGTFASW